MTTALTYTVAYNGDFTTISAGLAGIGTDLTASSTGNVTLSGSTTGTINLASGEVADFTGHTVTVGGVTRLIASYDNTTKIGTLGAIAGFAGTWGTAPGTGVGYTIDDVSVTLSIGQSSPGNNCWTILSGLALGAITTSATDTIMLTSATAANSALPLRFNSGGNPSQAVGITGSLYHAFVLTVAANFVTINGLQFQATSASGGIQANGTHFLATGCLIDVASAIGGLLETHGSSSSSNNCVFINANKTYYGVLNFTGTANTYGSTFFGCLKPMAGAYSSMVATDCVFIGTLAVNGSNTTYANCLSDAGSLPSGVGTIAASGQIANYAVVPLDCRPLSSGSLIGNGLANVNLTIDIFGISRPSSGAITVGASQNGFTPPETKVVTWLIAYNGDLQFSSSVPSVIDDATGNDLTYYSQGSTCPSTAVDSTHIVLDSGEDAASAVGHAIQWKTGNICVILSISGGIALVGALIGSGGTYASDFGGIPQSGDAYTIFPTAAVLNVGPPSSGHTIWEMAHDVNDNQGMVSFSAVTTTEQNYTMQSVLGTGGWGTFTTASALASPTDGVGQIFITNTGNHDSVLYFPDQTINITIKNLGIWCQGNVGGGSAGDGCWQGPTGEGFQFFPGVLFQNCVMRGDNYADDGDHCPICEAVGEGATYAVCVLVGTSRSFPTFHSGRFNAYRCTLLNTDSLRLIASGTQTSPITTINVVSTTGVNFNSFSGGYYPGWLGHSAIPIGIPINGPSGQDDIVSITSTSITIRNATTATIADGDTIYYGVLMDAVPYGSGSDAGSYTISQCAFFGFVQPATPATPATLSVSTCAADYASGGSGFTLMPYALQFGAADGVKTGTIDPRPKAGNGLGIGSPGGPYATDLFGNAFDTSVGAIQFLASTNTVTAGFFHVF